MPSALGLVLISSVLFSFFSFFRRPDFLAKLDALMEPSENVVVENENPWLGEKKRKNFWQLYQICDVISLFVFRQTTGLYSLVALLERFQRNCP